MKAPINCLRSPDESWVLVEPLVPGFAVRPQGGGTAPVGDRAVFTAIVFVLTSGCAWRMLPSSFGVTVPTAHRRFTDWTKAGSLGRIHRAVLDEPGTAGLIDWCRAVVDAATVRARRGSLTGPNAVDRAKRRSKIHVLTDRAGLPLVVEVSAANLNDHLARRTLVRAVPAVRRRGGSRRFRPDKLHADKAYDVKELRRWLIDRGVMVRISRRDIDTSDKLGRYRWVVERTLAWLTNGYRRLSARWERHARNCPGFATFTCFKKPPT
ncbi:IS5 family transposase [Actinokineospora spheciospongiae]|uniref:IS5 family transposase n=1 Tax=Actinokineospora spheciospongiae TaxID=909613 RepID=UPI0038995057